MNLKNIIFAMSLALTLLFIPLIGMLFTDQVKWNAFDFLIMGSLLAGTAAAISIALQKVKSTKYRFVVLSCILFAFFVVWAELAVGIFGTPFAGS